MQIARLAMAHPAITAYHVLQVFILTPIRVASSATLANALHAQRQQQNAPPVHYLAASLFLIF
jgi:hypothetical protein